MISAMHISRRVVAVTVVVLIVVGAGVLMVVRASGSGPRLETAEVSRGSIETTIELAGSVAASDTRSVAFATTGTVVGVEVAEGEVVAVDQVLAVLDSTQQQAQLAAAEASLASAEARLAADRAGLSDARKTAARDPIAQAEQSLANARRAQTDTRTQGDLAVRQAQQALADAREQLEADQAAGAPPTVIAADEAVVSQAERAVETARAQRTAANNQAAGAVASAQKAVTAARNSYAVATEPAPAALIAADEAAVASAEAQVAAARAALDAATLRAPIAGTVTEVGIRVGDRPGAGGLTGGAGTGATVTITTLDQLRIEATASEIDVVSLAIDQPVIVTVDALPEQAIDGTVCRIGAVGSELQGVSEYPVTICLDASVPDLRVGMTANGSVILERREDVLLVPIQAITTVDGRSTVQVLDEDGRPVEVEVTVGVTSGTRAEIVAGLSEGQEVVLPSLDGDPR
jgi:RND family efflux transporter MFP subunit